MGCVDVDIFVVGAIDVVVDVVECVRNFDCARCVSGSVALWVV